MRLVGVFLVVAVLAIVTAVVAGALAVRASRASDERRSYRRIAITAAVLTGVTVIVASLSSRASDLFQRREFPNDVMESMGADTWLGSVSP